MATIPSNCFLCGENPGLKLRGRESELIQNLTKDWATSLLTIFELESEDPHLEQILSHASFCVKCQEVVCNAEFTLKTIAQLNLELQLIKHDIQNVLYGHYATFAKSDPLGCPVVLEESIQNVITALGFKLEAQETHDNWEVQENELRVKRLQKLKRRQEYSCPAYSRSGRRVKPRHILPDEDVDEQDSSSESDPLLQDVSQDSDYEEQTPEKVTKTLQTNDKRSTKLGTTHATTEPEIDKARSTGLRGDEARLCPACPKSKLYGNFRCYRDHIRKRHPEVYSDKVARGEFMKRKSKPHAKTGPLRNPKERANCPKCSLNMSAYWLKNHLKYSCKNNSEKVEPLRCQVCPYFTTRKDTFDIHLRTHSDERAFACTLCSYTTKTKHGLVSHGRNVHGLPGAKLAQCTMCGEFIKGGDWLMKKHVEAVHENRRPFQCTLCDKAFKTQTSFNYHVRTHDNPLGRKRGLNKERPPKRRAPNKSRILPTDAVQVIS